MRILILSAALVLGASTAMAECAMTTASKQQQTVAQKGSSNAPQQAQRPPANRS